MRELFGLFLPSLSQRSASGHAAFTRNSSIHSLVRFGVIAANFVEETSLERSNVLTPKRRFGRNSQLRRFFGLRRLRNLGEVVILRDEAGIGLRRGGPALECISAGQPTRILGGLHSFQLNKDRVRWFVQLSRMPPSLFPQLLSCLRAARLMRACSVTTAGHTVDQTAGRLALTALTVHQAAQRCQFLSQPTGQAADHRAASGLTAQKVHRADRPVSTSALSANNSVPNARHSKRLREHLRADQVATSVQAADQAARSFQLQLRTEVTAASVHTAHADTDFD